MLYKPSLETILTRGVEDIIIRENLEKKLNSGKKLRIKLGIDPTAPDIHLGHTIALRKMRQFQELGHKAVLIIGDFTAQIGDPSGKSETRKSLSEDEIKKNLKGYLKQAGKVIDIKKAEIRYNSEWHKKKGLKALLELARSATVQQILKRDDFEKRLNAGTDISILETLYPLLQGYDSVAIKADVELGGTDQTFNLLMGRKVQRYFNLPEQDIMTFPLIEGTDGVHKMSKSYGNYIGVTDEPNDMFGKVMAIPDTLIEKYFVTLTDIDIPENLSPYDAKMLLAETIVSEYHSPKESSDAKNEFIRVFSKKELPDNISEIKIKNPISLIDLLLLTNVGSKSEARRLIEQDAIKINGVPKTNLNEIVSLKNGDVLKVGKRRFFKISL